MEDKQIIIGKQAIITDAPNKSLVGLKGIIVDETKNTFVFEINNEKKTVLKSNVILSLGEEERRFSKKRIEERIKSR